MNEWHRLADISTGTRRYLSRHEERGMVQSAALKLANIHRANLRLDRLGHVPELVQTMPDVSMPMAVELPGDMPTFPAHNTPPSRQSYESGPDTLPRPTGTSSPRTSGERSRPPPPPAAAPAAAPPPPPRASAQPPAGQTACGPGLDEDRLVVTAPSPDQWRHASSQDKLLVTSSEGHSRRQNGPITARPASSQQPHRIEPPPLPPKTSLLESQPGNERRPGGAALPYPLDDEAPPPVNMARKPNYRG